MTDTDQKTPVAMHNLVPEDLHDVVRNDALTQAVFMRASLRRASREEALIDCVRALVKSRDEMLRAYTAEMACRPQNMFKVTP